MRGRSKYVTHVEPRLLEITAWARNGDIDETIAKKLGLAYSTFRRYRDEHSALSAALKKGKEVIDFEVENALLKRALGFRYSEVTKELMKNPDTGKPELTVTKEVIKEMAPDVGAIAFWLKNRKPQVWRDRPLVEGETGETGVVELPGMMDNSDES